MILKALIEPMHEVVAAQQLPGAIHCPLFLQVARIGQDCCYEQFENSSLFCFWLCILAPFLLQYF